MPIPLVPVLHLVTPLLCLGGLPMLENVKDMLDYGVWAKLRLPRVLSAVVIRRAEQCTVTLLMTPDRWFPVIRLPMNGQLAGRALPNRTWLQEAVNSMALLRKCLLPMILLLFLCGLSIPILLGL